MPLLNAARRAYHTLLLDTIPFADRGGVPSNADKDSVASVKFATGILGRLKPEADGDPIEERLARLAGQKSGRVFEKATAAFIEATFIALKHLRPGTWEVLTGTGPLGIAQYQQYAHLFELEKAAKENPSLAVILGSDYIIRPDIVVVRATESDETINELSLLVDESVSRLASLRRINGGQAILHASISCKWTLRSDRAQNARSEALNLIRGRKGRVPHILCVTGEPTPSRLASIALGTGDIDCVYHFALNELLDAVGEERDSTADELLRIMVDGRRLKDISDLPLDIAI